MTNPLYDLYLKSLNPSAWWKLADAVGSGTAADSSGNGYVGTVSGGVVFGQPGPIASTPQDTAALRGGTVVLPAEPSLTRDEPLAELDKGLGP